MKPATMSAIFTCLVGLIRRNVNMTSSERLVWEPMSCGGDHHRDDQLQRVHGQAPPTARELLRRVLAGCRGRYVVGRPDRLGCPAPPRSDPRHGRPGLSASIRRALAMRGGFRRIVSVESAMIFPWRMT